MYRVLKTFHNNSKTLVYKKRKVQFLNRSQTKLKVKFSEEETSGSESFCRIISASLSKLKLLKCSKETGKKSLRRETQQNRKRKTSRHYFTFGHRFTKTTSSLLFPVSSFSTLALWCNPPCGCSCTGRWTESSPAAQSERLRGRFPERRRCW